MPPRIFSTSKAPVFSVTSEMGHGVIFMAFLVMVVGGLGSYKGAVIGALSVGLILSFGFQFFGGVCNSNPKSNPFNQRDIHQVVADTGNLIRRTSDG